MKYTNIERVVSSVGGGIDLVEFQIRTNDDDSILAKVYNEYLANVVQKAIEDDIEANEKNAWE